MLFSSAFFIVWFLPLFILAYLVTPQRFRNYTALLGSLVFYTWGAPKFVTVLLISGCLDYLLSRRLQHHPSRSLLAAGIGYNILTLFIFKYFNFFIDNARIITEGLGMNFPAIAEIALPLGISFFTFQKVSYLVDVYRKHTEPARNLFDYLLYVFLFPQLIAGPIVRYKEIAAQIRDRSENENAAYRLAGVQRFILGLTKKVLIADVLAPIADAAFSAGHLDMISAVLGLLAYTYQIYYDFSGYSDMAIGLGMIMGFRFPENFSWPYVAHGFRSFWQRWHITLTTWLRDYLYYPIGGSRKVKWKVIRNLWIVFLLSGLWHGASWNFVIWGLWHGIFISIDRYTKFFKGLNPVPGALLTFGLVSLGWIWFRAETVGDALTYFTWFFDRDMSNPLVIGARQWTTLAVATVFAFLPPGSHGVVRGFHGENNRMMFLKTFFAVILLILCLGQIAISDAQPFIYFRF